MSFLGTIRNWFGGLLGRPSQRVSEKLSELAGVKEGYRRESPARHDEDLLTALVKVPEVARVAYRVAEKFGDVDFFVESRSRVRVHRGPLARFFERPNPDMSGATFFALLEMWWSGLGEACILVFVEAGEVYAYPVPKTWCHREEGRWRVRLDSQDFYVTEDPSNHADGVLVRIVKPDPRNPYARGIGLLSALADEVETLEKASKYTLRYFDNDATPRFLLTQEAGTDDTVKQAQRQWDRQHRGFRNAYKAAFLGSQWTPHVLGSSFNEAGVLELSDRKAELVRTIYGVPPEIIGQTGNSNRATITEAERIMARGCLEPRARVFETELNAKFMPIMRLAGLARVGDRISHTSTIPDDVETRRAMMEMFPAAFTVNEIRLEAGLSERADGNVYYTPEPMQVQAGEVVEMNERVLYIIQEDAA